MLENLTALNLILLGVAMFASGFIDAIAGGGGLIQTPAMLLSFPDRNPVEVVATSKTAAFFGTTTAAIQYRKFIKTDPKLLIAMVIPAFIGSGIGAHLASRISAGSYKSSIFFVMIAIFLYTLVKPELGKEHVEKHSPQKLMVIGSVAAFIIGFYDGLIGPGTGTILMIALVALMGFAFVGASAIAKVVNVATNVGAILVFGINGAVIWQIGIIMGVANISGAVFGARLAIKGGSTLVRKVFLIVTVALIVKVGIATF